MVILFFSGFPYHKVASRTLYLLVLDYDRWVSIFYFCVFDTCVFNLKTNISGIFGIFFIFGISAVFLFIDIRTNLRRGFLRFLNVFQLFRCFSVFFQFF